MSAATKSAPSELAKATAQHEQDVSALEQLQQRIRDGGHVEPSDYAAARDRVDLSREVRDAARQRAQAAADAVEADARAQRIEQLAADVSRHRAAYDKLRDGYAELVRLLRTLPAEMTRLDGEREQLRRRASHLDSDLHEELTMRPPLDLVEEALLDAPGGRKHPVTGNRTYHRLHRKSDWSTAT